MNKPLDSIDERLERRVRGAFASELHRADADLAVTPLHASTRGRRTRPLAIAAAAALTFVVAAGAVGVGAFISQARNPTTPSAAQTPPAGRYPDGIPSVWQGERVMRWDQALAMRSTASDETSFLVGVWLDVPPNGSACDSSGHLTPAASPGDVRPACLGGIISAEAGAPGQALSMVATLRYVGVLTTGPAIIRAQIHHPRPGQTSASGQCAATTQTCDPTIVIEDIVWAGDAYTASEPISVAAAQGAVRSATGIDFEPGNVPPGSSALYLAPGGWAMTRVPPTDDPTGLNMFPTYPTDSTILVPPFMDTVGEASNDYIQPLYAVFVLPSPAAVARALPGLDPGVAGSLSIYNLMPLTAITAIARAQGHEFNFRWLVSGNVAVAVLIHVQPTSGDLRFLNSLESALNAKAAAATH